MPLPFYAESTSDLPCPFQGAYHFIYANNSGGHCRYPTSYVTSCASMSHLRIRFRHCPDASYTYDRGKSVFDMSKIQTGSFQLSLVVHSRSYIVGKSYGIGLSLNHADRLCSDRSLSHVNIIWPRISIGKITFFHLSA